MSWLANKQNRAQTGSAKVKQIVKVPGATKTLLSSKLRCPHYRGRHGRHGPVDDDEEIPLET